MLRHMLVASIAAISIVNAQAPTLSTMDAYKKAVQSSKPTVIMFTGSHCGPCRSMKPHFHNIAATRTDVQCYLVDTSCASTRCLLNHLNVQSIPTLICCHDGKVYHRENGGLTERGISRSIQQFHKKRTSKNSLQSAIPAAQSQSKTADKKQTAQTKTTKKTKRVRSHTSAQKKS